MVSGMKEDCKGELMNFHSPLFLYSRSYRLFNCNMFHLPQILEPGGVQFNRQSPSIGITRRSMPKTYWRKEDVNLWLRSQAIINDYKTGCDSKASHMSSLPSRDSPFLCQMLSFSLITFDLWSHPSLNPPTLLCFCFRNFVNIYRNPSWLVPWFSPFLPCHTLYMHKI